MAAQIDAAGTRKGSDMEVQMKEAELEQIRAQIGKLMAETAKIQKEAQWYPVVVAGGIIGGTAALVGVLIKIFT